MKLLIPKDKAIAIISQRIQELNAYPFNSKVWKDRTLLDIKQIFGFSDQSLQVSQIYFETAITSEKIKKMQEGKEAARGLLSSYIDFIEQYSQISIQKAQIKDQGFEQKYYDLLAEYNKNTKEHINLLEEHTNLLDENSTTLDENAALKEKNDYLRENTLQLDEITIARLFQSIKNLPTKQIVGLIVILVSVLSGLFTLGILIEKTNSNLQNFDLRNENKELKLDTQNNHAIIGKMKDTIELQREKLNKNNIDTLKK